MEVWPAALSGSCLDNFGLLVLFCDLRSHLCWYNLIFSVQERGIWCFTVLFIDKVKNWWGGRWGGRNHWQTSLHWLKSHCPLSALNCSVLWRLVDIISYTPIGHLISKASWKRWRWSVFSFILEQYSTFYSREWILRSEEVKLWPYEKGRGNQGQSRRESIVLGERWLNETYLMLKNTGWA